MSTEDDSGSFSLDVDNDYDDEEEEEPFVVPVDNADEQADSKSDQNPLKRKAGQVSQSDEYDPPVEEAPKKQKVADNDQYVYGPDDFDNNDSYLIGRKKAAAFEEDLDENEREEERYNLLLVAAQHANRSKLSNMAANNSQHLTAEERRSLKMLETKAAGLPIDHLVDKDTQNMLFVPVRPPNQSRADAILKKEPAYGDHLFCFACMHGAGYALLETEMIRKFNEFMCTVLDTTDNILASVQIAYYYDKVIQQPVNEPIRKMIEKTGDKRYRFRMLPDWSPRQVYICLTRHRSHEPSLRRKQVLESLRENREILEGQLYVVDSVIYEQGRRPTKRDVKTKEKTHRMLMATIDREEKWLKIKADKLDGANSKVSIKSGRGSLIAPKTNLFNQQTIDSFVTRQGDSNRL